MNVKGVKRKGHSRTNEWRRRKARLSMCRCQYHQPILRAGPSKCTCQYHRVPSPCCEYHGSIDSSVSEITVYIQEVVCAAITVCDVHFSFMQSDDFYGLFHSSSSSSGDAESYASNVSSSHDGSHSNMVSLSSLQIM